MKILRKSLIRAAPRPRTELLDRRPAHQMLVDDPIEFGDVQAGVPGAFGIDDADRALFTDPEAIDLVPEHPTLSRLYGGGFRFRLARPGWWGRGQALRLETTLEMSPQQVGFFPRRTLRRCLIRTQKDVALGARNRERVGNGLETLSIVHIKKLDHSGSFVGCEQPPLLIWRVRG